MFDKIMVGVGFLVAMVGIFTNDPVGVVLGSTAILATSISLAKEEIIKAIKENK